jgi:hypothetical protein
MHTCILWTSLHTSEMHGPVYTTWCVLWTSYTHQTCTVPYTRHDVFCEQRTHIKNSARMCISRKLLHLDNKKKPFFVFTASLSTFFILISSDGRKCNFFVRHNGTHIKYERLRIDDMMFFVNNVHTSSMHASCEHHTHIRHARILWTSYTHQTCMHLLNIEHTSGMHLVNVVQKSEMHASCEHHTHIKHASSEHHTHIRHAYSHNTQPLSLSMAW